MKQISKRDWIALGAAVALGVGFGYLSVLAVYGAVAVGSFYGGVVLALLVAFGAEERKVMVWQAGVLSYAFYVASGVIRGGAFGLGMGVFFFVFSWAGVSVISSPVVIAGYWRRQRRIAGQQANWFWIGIGLAALVGFLWRDEFVLFGLVCGWMALCAAKFGWDWSRGVDSAGARRGTWFALGGLAVVAIVAVLVGVFWRQEAFREAVRQQHIEVAGFFVRLGADVSAPNAKGYPALIEATSNGTGNPGMVRKLISWGADVNRPLAGGGGAGGTVLETAAASGRTEICAMLLEAGADVNAKDLFGRTSLVAGLGGGSPSCVPMLIEHGADVNARDLHGKTPLMLLAAFAPDNATAQRAIELALERGADVTAVDEQGNTAEDWARIYKRDEYAERLRKLSEERTGKDGATAQ